MPVAPSDIVYDAAIIGGGPAGAACAALCAQSGMRVLVLEKNRFPRDKVCGDCLNPGCWPLLEELGLAHAVLALPHAPLREVAFIAPNGRRFAFPLESAGPGEIAITRRSFDALLLRRARTLGAEVCENSSLQHLSKDPAGLWHIETSGSRFTARTLIAADGRNSTVARLLNAAPKARRDRIGLQTHLSSRAASTGAVELHFLPEGYCGVAPVGEGLTNICLVAPAARLERLKSRVEQRFQIPSAQEWHSIAPLARAPIGPLVDGVLYLGDAARVVEPFTGEGIYYALASASAAARHLVAGTVPAYPASHALLYRRRLWINRLARWAVTHPHSGALALHLLGISPFALQKLVRKVIDRPIGLLPIA